MPNEYVSSLGIDVGPFVAAIREAKSLLESIRSESKATGTAMSESFTVAAKATTSLTTEAVKGAKSIAEQGRAAREVGENFKSLATLMGNLSGLTGKSFDPSLIKQYSAEITKAGIGLKDFISKSAQGFDKTKLAALDAELLNVTDDFQALKTVTGFIKANLGDLNLNPEEAGQLAQNIDLLQSAFQHVSQEETIFEGKTQSAKARLRELKNELANLDTADPRFPALVREAAELEDKIGDVNAQVKLLGSDTSKLDAISQGVQGVVGVFTAAQSAMALFGDQNEEIQKTLLKVNAAMGLLQGLQQVGLLLDSKSALNQSLRLLLTKGEVVATEELAVAQGEAIVTQTGLNIVMLENPVGILLIAITSLLAIYELYTHTLGAATDAEKLRNAEIESMAEAEKKAADAIAKEAGQLNILLATAKSESSTRQQKVDAINELKRSYPEYLNSLSLENLYTKESSVLIEKQIGFIRQRAIVQAAQDVYIEKLKKVAEAEAELNDIRTNGASYFEQLKGNLFHLGDALTGTSAQENALQNKIEDVNKANVAASGAFNVVTGSLDKFANEMNGDTAVFDNYIHKFDLFAKGASNFNPTFPLVKPFDPKAFDDEKKAAIDAAQYRVDVAKKGTIEELDARRNLVQVTNQFEVLDKRKTDAEKKSSEGKYLGDIQALNEEYQARNIKDAVAFAQYKVLLQKEGSKKELEANLQAIDVQLKADLSAAGITNGEVLKLKLEAEKKKQELTRSFQVQQLENEISNQNALISESIEGTKEEFNAKSKIIALQAQVEIANAKGNADKIKEIKADELRQESELKKSFDAKVVESGLNVVISDTNARLAVVEKGSAEELALKNALAEKQAELDINAAGLSIKNETERLAKIKEINVKKDAEIVANDKAFLKARIEAQVSFTTSSINLENARLAAQANDKNIDPKKKFELEQQIRANELDDIENQIKALKEKHNRQLVDEESFQTQLNNLETEGVKKRDEIADAEADKPRFKTKDFLFKLFGLDPNDPDQNAAVSAIGDLIGTIVQNIEDAAQRQVDATEKMIESTQGLIDTQQEQVDKQKELSDKGLANDLANQQKKLDDLRAKKALETKAHEDAQKKLAQIRKEEAIATAAAIVAKNIETGVNMINAASEVFSANAGVPLVGIVLSLGFIATMVSTFLAIKNAFKTPDTVPKLRYGGGLDIRGQRLQGPSHENGGMGLYNERTGAKVAEYEGDEWLFAIRRESVEKHRPLLEAINADRLPINYNKYFREIVDAPSMPMTHVHNILVLQNEVKEQQANEAANSKQDIAELTKELKALRKDYKAVQDSKSERTDYGDYVEIKEGARTRRIWKNKEE